MKMQADHFNQLQKMIAEKIDALGDLQPFFVRYEKNGGNWKRRFCWDTLYAVPFETRRRWFDEVYKYANDDHIDTALRKIMKDYM
jgi:hypothetical protein